jgi:hypothetical protein
VSSIRLTGTDRPTIGWFALATAWMGAGIPFGVSTLARADSDARPLIATLLAISIVAAIVAVTEGWHRHSRRWLGGALAISALTMPTGFAAVINLVVLLAAVALVAGRRTT